MRRLQTGSTRIDAVVGAASVSGGSTVLSFFTEALPVLQFISVCVGIVAGVLTIALAIKKLNHGRNH